MGLVVSGLLNKQIGGELRISEITVKAHRGQVMRKMGAKSLASLVKMSQNRLEPRLLPCQFSLSATRLNPWPLIVRARMACGSPFTALA